jgi:protein TonB
MIEKKSSKGSLEKRRTTFLIIGFVIVIGLVYICFELFAPEKEVYNSGNLKGVEVIEVFEAPVTDLPKPPPPAPPQPDYIIKPVDREVLFDKFPDFPEYNENEDIPPYEPIPLIHEEPTPPPPVKIPEKNPEPVGGYDAMYAFLKANLKYPALPLQCCISGTVYVDFIVETDGSISNVTVAHSVHPDLDKEAVRVVKMMPNWKPGEQLGKPVRCLFNIPIRFTIN